MSILVTGGTGALGHHLLKIINKPEGALVSFQSSPVDDYRRLAHVEYEQGNLLTYKDILAVMARYKPLEIYHLASQSSVGVSHQKPFETLSINLLGTQHLLEAARQIVPKARILLLSSCEVYGSGMGLLDILHQEDEKPNPLTPYATSKACMEILGNQFRNAYNMSVFSVRPFHFTGMYHSRRFVLPSITSQLIRIKKEGGEPVIYTGNLDVSRDVIDVRDLSRALALLMKTSESGEVYNVCSGKARTIRELVGHLILKSGIDVETRVDLNLERENDIPLMMGSPEKIMLNTGWRPMIAIEDSLDDLYNEMEQRMAWEQKLFQSRLK
jgi:GDP-4-dehydro-6-deoxy-D-mannose reductase